MGAKRPGEFDPDVLDPDVLDTRAPIRILKHFQPQAEWVLGPGDMLYLPPGTGHPQRVHAVALSCCLPACFRSNEFRSQPVLAVRNESSGNAKELSATTSPDAQ